MNAKSLCNDYNARCSHQEHNLIQVHFYQLKGHIMKNHKYVGSTLLVLALLASGASFAAESSTTDTDQSTSYGKEVRAKIANMTPEQRKAFFAEKKASWESMTPEQRKEFMNAIRSPIAGMTKEEREAFRAEMKAKSDKMTPEKKEELKTEHMKNHAERMEHRMERREAMEHPTRVERPVK